MKENLESLLPASEEGFYPIRTVSEVTGVNAITLRAWERRYGLFQPQRTPKGHRLYSQQDILRIQQVLQLLEKGVAIGRVSSALKKETKLEDLSDITMQNSTVNAEDNLLVADQKRMEVPSENQWAVYKDKLLEAANSYDLEKLERLNHEVFSLYPVEIISRSLLRPLLNELRNQADQLQSLSGNYHFYWNFLEQRIGGLFLKSTLQNRGKKILLMAYGDSKANVELMLFGLPLLTHGYRVVVLGSDIPFDAIPMTLSRADSEALIIYSASSTPSTPVHHDTNQASHSVEMITSIKAVAESMKIPVFIAGEHSETEAKALEESGLTQLKESTMDQLKEIDAALDI